MLVKIVSNSYVSISTVESCELQVPAGDMDFLIKQVNQIATNQVSKQLGGTEQRNHKHAFHLKAAFYVINSTANQYFQRTWTRVKSYSQLVLNNSK